MTNFQEHVKNKLDSLSNIFKHITNGELSEEERQLGFVKSDLLFDTSVASIDDKNSLHENNRIDNIVLGELVSKVRYLNPNLHQSILVNHADLIERLNSLYLNINKLPLQYPDHAFAADVIKTFTYSSNIQYIFKRHITQTDVGCTCGILLQVKATNVSDKSTSGWVTLKSFSIDLTPEWTLKNM